jgi:hypothetical protein
VPRGVPHRVTRDDVYGEYFIPEGALVLGNTWYALFALLEDWRLRLTFLRHLLHDEANFGPETEKFKPERFLVPGVKDPSLAFGFGRRCDFFGTLQFEIYCSFLQ